MESTVSGKRDGLSNWVRQFVTIVDLEQKIYKLQERWFGIFKSGEFKPLPKIEYVLVFRSLFAKCEGCSLEENMAENPNAYFQVSLVHGRNRRIVVQETKDRETAFSTAKNLALGLKTRLRDSATVLGASSWVI